MEWESKEMSTRRIDSHIIWRVLGLSANSNFLRTSATFVVELLLEVYTHSSRRKVLPTSTLAHLKGLLSSPHDLYFQTTQTQSRVKPVISSEWPDRASLFDIETTQNEYKYGATS